MAVFVMADTHLSLSSQKPMDVFGVRWTDYITKIKNNWNTLVKPTDTVILPGDISWAMYLEEAKEDLLFLDSLPGNKIILKGNHDFWWESATKMRHFLEMHQIQTLSFLQNNAFFVEPFIICGTRGWYAEDKKLNTQHAPDAQKMINREQMRLHLSLEEGKKLQQAVFQERGIRPEIIVCMHFPPYFTGYICDELILELYRYNVKRCFFGHIHGSYNIPFRYHYMDIDFYLIASDYLHFTPFQIPDTDSPVDTPHEKNVSL